MWQNHVLLEVINKPLTSQTKKQVLKGDGTVGQAALAQQGLLKVAADTQAALGVLRQAEQRPARRVPRAALAADRH